MNTSLSATHSPEYHIVWQPLPGSQTRFLSCPVFEALLEGTRGGGKTDALLMSFAQYCGRGFGENWRGALFRLTYPQLADVVAKSKRWFFSIFPGIRFNESDYRWTWPTGETLYFRYGATEDDYWNYHGHEYCVAVDTPILTAEGWRRIDSLQIGEKVMTLDGLRAVTKIVKPKMKQCVKAYVYDARHYLTGVQVQSVEHRLLTSAQRPCLSTCELSGSVGQESVCSSSWQSYKSLLCGRQENQEIFAWSEDEKNCDKACQQKRLKCGLPGPLFAPQALFLPLRDQDGFHQRQATQSRCHGRLPGSLWGSCRERNAPCQDPPPLVVPGQSHLRSCVWNVASCAHTETHGAQDFLYGCHPSSHFCGEQPQMSGEVCQDGVLSHDGVAGPIHVYLHRDDQDSARKGSPFACSGLVFDHPYTGQSVKADLPLEEGYVFLVPCEAHLTMDITVEGSNHYITRTGLVNKNCWLGFEELTNWRDLTFLEAMMSTCRSSFAGMPRMIRATCNPYGVGHGWVKERYKIGEVPPGTIIREAGQKPRVRIHSSIFENTHLLDADPDYLPTLEAIRDPNRKRAWLLGDWDIHIGSFLEGVWNPQQHVVDPFMIPSSWRVWKAMDWGYAAPYAIYWFAMDHDGVIYIWRELYGAGEKPGQGTRESAAEVARRIRVIEAHDERMGYEYRMNLADPSIFAKSGAERSIGQIFRENGVRWQPAWNAKGSRVNGAQEIIRLLSENRLKVFRTCRHWLATVPSIAPDEINPEDVDTRANDHAWDATRYGIMRRRRSPDEPGRFIEDDILDVTVENSIHTFKV